MPKSITLIAEGGDPAGVQGPLGFLCELASDSRFLAEHPDALTIGDLLGDYNDVKARAFALSQRLLTDEPAHRGVQQLRVFEEVVIRQLQVGFQLLALHDRLIELGYSECQFDGPSKWSDLLAQAAQLSGGRLKVRNSSQHMPRALRALHGSLRKLADAPTLQSASKRVAQKVRSLADPYGLMGARNNGKWSKGALWFYSTAHTYTLTGMAFEPFFPEPLTYFVENTKTGGAPLRAQNRGFTTLQEFGSLNFVPSSQEIASARMAIDEHLAAAGLTSSDERLVVALLRASPFYATFVRQHLPQGLYASELFQHWIEKTQPKALVTGNPVFEEYALHAARRNGIPTLVLQHGVLGDFCQFSDPRCDTYVVRGTFWRDFLSEASRKKAKVLNHTAQSDLETTPSKKTSILFLTAPYHAHDLWHPDDLREILFRLMDVCARADFTMTIRVHPLDSIKTYEALVASYRPNGTLRPEVKLTQSTPLTSDLETAAAAVLYSSTVFLDCLAAQIPVISFGWHDFSFKSEIERLGVFHFAPDLDGLAALAGAAAEGKLAPFRGPIKMFLEDTPDHVLRTELKKAVDQSAVPASAVTPCK